jgi:Cd2+/Zn2+-exporting ATPase
MSEGSFMAKFDKFLIVFLVLGIIFSFTGVVSDNFDNIFLIVISVLATIPVAISSIISLKNKKISVDLLASIALAASLIAREWTSAVFINLMLTSARILQTYAQGRASSAIKSLLKLRPTTVKVKRGDQVTVEEVAKLQIGDLIVVESGERMPVDGTVESGDLSLDQSSLTGESVPVSKTKGDNVLSSTLVVSGSGIIKTEKVGKDTMLEKIVGLVEQAQEDKPGIHTMAEKFTAWYIVISLLAAIGLYFVFRNFNLILALLLVVCADDIAIAVPIAFLVSIGKLAKKGIIVKGGNFLEGMMKVETFIVDKTGTLTLGKLNVEKVVTFGKHSENEVLKYITIGEFFSEHPAAKAIVAYAEEKKIVFKEPVDFNETPGRGSSATDGGIKIFTGKARYLTEEGVKISAEQTEQINKIKDEGFNTTLVSYDGELAGLVALADQVRPGIKETIIKMRRLGIRHWVMLTGDNEKAAQRIGDEVGISEIHANLLPEDKLNYIRGHLGRGTKLAMVGDGVNDAAALALADVGIAMGAIGSDAAIEAADIALMKDDFTKIPEIISVGRKTMKIAHQDFWIWGIVNVIGITLVFAKVIGPEGAAAFNFITDFFPLVNSFRLIKIK